MAAVEERLQSELWRGAVPVQVCLVGPGPPPSHPVCALLADVSLLRHSTNRFRRRDPTGHPPLANERFNPPAH